MPGLYPTGRGNHPKRIEERCFEICIRVAAFSEAHLSIAMLDHVFLSSPLKSYRRSRYLCSLARLAEVIDCVEPFVTSALWTLSVGFSWQVSRLDFSREWAFESQVRGHANYIPISNSKDIARPGFCSDCPRGLTTCDDKEIVS